MNLRPIERGQGWPECASVGPTKGMLMKAGLNLASVFFLLFTGAGCSGGLTADKSDPPIILVDDTPKPGCRAQLDGSSCRPDKFPPHTPDPEIPVLPSEREKPKPLANPDHQIDGQSLDCKFGVGKCFCTNDMAAAKALKFAVRDISVFGYSDRVLVKATRDGRQFEAMLTRERTCPVLYVK